jgi:hypothetical protein
MSNELRFLLDQNPFAFPISVWSEKTFGELALRSPGALSLLGLPDIETSPSPEPIGVHLFLPKGALRFDVLHQHNPPRQFAYFRVDGAIQKSFTDLEFKLNFLFLNRAAQPLVVTDVVCRTVSYRQVVNERIVVQNKPKGIFTPEVIQFAPSRVVGGEVHLLGNKALSIAARETELVRVELTHGVAPGYYELQFLASAPTESQVFVSPIFPILIQSERDNTCDLIVFGKHYDSAVGRILELPEETWRPLTNPRPEGIMRILGPSMYDIVDGTYTPTCWQIREIACEMDDDGGWTIPHAPPVEILDLPGPIEERLHTLGDDIVNLSGRNKLAGEFSKQLARRRRLICDPTDA